MYADNSIRPTGTDCVPVAGKFDYLVSEEVCVGFKKRWRRNIPRVYKELISYSCHCVDNLFLFLTSL